MKRHIAGQHRHPRKNGVIRSSERRSLLRALTFSSGSIHSSAESPACSFHATPRETLDIFPKKSILTGRHGSSPCRQSLRRVASKPHSGRFLFGANLVRHGRERDHPPPDSPKYLSTLPLEHPIKSDAKLNINLEPKRRGVASAEPRWRRLFYLKDNKLTSTCQQLSRSWL